MGNFINHTDQRFGKLLVLNEYERRPRGKKNAIYWKCQCDCGNVLFVLAGQLTPGVQSSCGCDPYRGEIHTTHGRSNTPEYRAWQRMKQRCYYPGIRDFHRWGGRGITVCERWKDSFETFLMDMGEMPKPGCQLDRIDNNGNYEPDNCRWASRKEQCRNTERNRYISFDGKTLSVAEWSEITGIRSNTIRRRLDVCGWSVEKTLTSQARK